MMAEEYSAERVLAELKWFKLLIKICPHDQNVSPYLYVLYNKPLFYSLIY